MHRQLGDRNADWVRRAARSRQTERAYFEKTGLFPIMRRRHRLRSSLVQIGDELSRETSCCGGRSSPSPGLAHAPLRPCTTGGNAILVPRWPGAGVERRTYGKCRRSVDSSKEQRIWVTKGKRTKAKRNSRKKPSVLQRKNDKGKRNRKTLRCLVEPWRHRHGRMRDLRGKFLSCSQRPGVGAWRGQVRILDAG